jgi:hypothetical protein
MRTLRISAGPARVSDSQNCAARQRAAGAALQTVTPSRVGAPYNESGGAGVWCGTAVRADGAAVRKDLSGVLEDDHSIAEQTPSLFREGGDDSCGIVVDGVRGWTRWLVLAHRGSPDWG